MLMILSICIFTSLRTILGEVAKIRRRDFEAGVCRFRGRIGDGAICCNRVVERGSGKCDGDLDMQ